MSMSSRLTPPLQYAARIVSENSEPLSALGLNRFDSDRVKLFNDACVFQQSLSTA